MGTILGITLMSGTSFTTEDTTTHASKLRGMCV
jgi:hypothetical protein